jgi:lipopolysaccharide transport system permease protein
VSAPVSSHPNNGAPSGRGALREFPFASFLAHGSLVWELTKREILGRYRGASFGLAWSVISPFMMLCVYAFAFGGVLKSRWTPIAGGDYPYTIILFVGLIIHGFFAECITRAPGLIVGNPNFVKRVVFPLDILPWPMVLSALFHALISVIVLAFMMLIFRERLHVSMLLLPVVFFPLMLVALGVSWFLAALGVYFRDINQVMPVLATALLFLSSAVVPVSALSSGLQVLFHLNPLTFFIDEARIVALAGGMPHWGELGLSVIAGLLVVQLGHAWFTLTRKGFADVL